MDIYLEMGRAEEEYWNKVKSFIFGAAGVTKE